MQLAILSPLPLPRTAEYDSLPSPSIEALKVLFQHCVILHFPEK